MPEPLTIPISIFDVTMDFTRPNLRLAITGQEVVEELFESFAKWDAKVDDIEVIKEGKPSEQGVKFKLPKRRTSFFFGPVNCRLIWDDANWETAAETIEILQSALAVLHKTGKAEIGSYKPRSLFTRSRRTYGLFNCSNHSLHPSFSNWSPLPLRLSQLLSNGRIVGSPSTILPNSRTQSSCVSSESFPPAPRLRKSLTLF
jgi:hypothetical protein